MFDKIPSIKDFILYVIPGLMICYCSISLITYKPTDQLPGMKDLSQSTSFAIISVLFAFIIGFISSQIQIILFNKIIDWKIPGIRTLNGSNLTESIKRTIVVKFIKVFNLDNDTDFLIIAKDKSTLSIIINYLILNVNSEAVKYFERDSNMSSFAISLPFPTSLLIILLFLRLQLHWLGFSILLILTIFVTYFCYRSAINFRRGWVEKVFFQFLIFDKK